MCISKEKMYRFSHLNILSSVAHDAHSHARTPIKCSAPLPVAKVTKPAHLLLPKSKEKHFSFSRSLCCRQALISVSSSLSSLSAPVQFSLLNRKEVDRNKGAYSQISPKEVLSLPLSSHGAVTSKPLSKNGGIKTARYGSCLA